MLSLGNAVGRRKMQSGVRIRWLATLKMVCQCTFHNFARYENNQGTRTIKNILRKDPEEGSLGNNRMLLHKGSFAKRVEHTEIQTACRTCKRCRFTFPTLPRPRHPVFISSLLFRLSLRVPESSAVQLYNSTFPSLPPTLPTPPILASF